MRGLLTHFAFTKAELAVLSRLRGELLIPSAPRPRGDVLVDIADSLCECAEQLAFAKYFALTHRLQPALYFPGFSSKRLLAARVLGGRAYLGLSRGSRLAQSLGVSPGLDATHVTPEIQRLARDDYETFRRAATTKEAVVSYRLEGVAVGTSIYDTYLRERRVPTVDFEDPTYARVATEAFVILRTVAAYFAERNVKAAILGHCVYNNWKILSDYAVSRGCQVYVTYNSRTIPIHSVNRSRGLQTPDHSDYRAQFLELPHAEQLAGRAAGLAYMGQRVSGEVDPGISYMAKTAYGSHADLSPLSVDRSKKVVVLMLHSFFDSPHIYSEMAFPDFYEWVEATLAFLTAHPQREAFEVLLKPHPNRFPEEDRIIAKFLRKFPSVHLMPPETSNRALSTLNLACVLTVYGTVAPELAYLRIPVITCGDNPASSFDFCFHAKNREEYFSLLGRAGSLAVTEAQSQEVGDFVFMHYLRQRQPGLADYPFARYARHNRRHNHERVGSFRYADFERLLNGPAGACIAATSDASGE
jgi:hypothetical protein